MIDDQPNSTDPSAEPGGINRTDGPDPLAMFPTETDVAAAQDAEARAAKAKPRLTARTIHARTVAAPAPRIRRRGRLWLAVLVIGVLALAAGLTAWVTVPGLAPLLRSRLAAVLPQSTATLVVETVPPGWDVTEGGRRLGATPLTVSLPPGRHSLVLRHGAAERPLAVTLMPGTEVVHHLELTEPPAPPPPPAVGTLQVTTVPEGAAVSLDGVPRGTTPLQVANLAPGDHAIVVANAYRVVNQRVAITAGETATLLVPLGQAPAPPRPAAPAPTSAAFAAAAPAPAPPVPAVGWLSVAAGIELQVYEGDSLIGSSRSQRIALTPGLHTLRLVNAPLGFQTTAAVTVRAGAVGTVTIQVPNGSLSVNAVPWAEVALDGRVIGETPIANYPVALGSHELVLRNPRYAEQRRTVIVSLSSPARVGVDLRQ